MIGYRQEAMAVKDNSKLFFYERNLPKGELKTPSADFLQVAELAIAEESEIRGHLQICDEITYAISGRASVWSGDHRYEMSAGQIHYIKRGVYHRIAADLGENFRYCCIGFLPCEDYREIGGFLEAVSEKEEFLITDEGNIKTLFPMLIDEFQVRDEESAAMVHFYFCQMLIQISRMLTGTSRQKLRRLNASDSNQAVYRALKFIDREYPQLTQARQVAAALSYSEYYLCHIFREKMDMTVKEYLMQKKLKLASELLETSSMSVSEIAEHLSFSSLHAFGVAFKRHMDMSPTEYRRSLTEKIE